MFREMTYCTISDGIIAKDLRKIIRFSKNFSVQIVPARSILLLTRVYKLWIRTWDNLYDKKLWFR